MWPYFYGLSSPAKGTSIEVLKISEEIKNLKTFCAIHFYIHHTPGVTENDLWVRIRTVNMVIFTWLSVKMR